MIGFSESPLFAAVDRESFFSFRESLGPVTAKSQDLARVPGFSPITPLPKGPTGTVSLFWGKGEKG